VIENLLNVGYIDQTFDIYKAFPLWHILCSYIYQIMQLTVTPAKVMFFTNGIIYGCLVLIVYLVASELLNTRIALLSSLFMCFNTDAIFYGMYSILAMEHLLAAAEGKTSVSGSYVIRIPVKLVIRDSCVLKSTL
jgi:hypothetical protein